MKTKYRHSQLILCQLAALENAACNHEKMAEMQEAAGNKRLARDSRQTAYARRLAHDYLNDNPKAGISAALEYADRRICSNV